jgi:hypothetical protein
MKNFNATLRKIDSMTIEEFANFISMASMSLVDDTSKQEIIRKAEAVKKTKMEALSHAFVVFEENLNLD